MSASLDSFAPNTVERYAPGDDDVVFDIKYCGICHTVRKRNTHKRIANVIFCIFFMFSRTTFFFLEGPRNDEKARKKVQTASIRVLSSRAVRAYYYVFVAI